MKALARAVPNLYWPDRLFRNERKREERRRARWAAAERAAEHTLLVSHANCLDGVGSAIVTLRALGHGVGVAYVQPGDMAEVLAWLAPLPAQGRRLLVADLSLQKEQYASIVASCAALRAGGWRIEWRDHHHKQWEGLDLGRLRQHLDALEVNADATESGTSLMQKALAPSDNFLARLAHTIRDRDLWWNKTPDSETLEFALTQMGTKAFVKAYLDAHADSPTVLPEVAAAAKREREEQKAILARLLGEARYFGHGPTRVGVIYGWLPKNTGLHELLTDYSCHLAINVRPNGKASLRSRKDAPVCHRVAQQFNGGGHPNASGADLGLKGLPYYWYIVRRGKVRVVQRMADAAVAELARGP
jgi:oligoribonuclease NrnB/cAMP/cGMP phosphodiesterase (DHH superfamily)